ncbi:leucine-rich repeat and immunoglobulin-like domain-containing nogo receptor-interacting protein 3 [Leucoraja erinacea]|uniref:leucine-rich repeat and immunoglobulin-like domain-containing nogo receptor-interacting protein 3 n=1 Tax=Leucoraja erinaceus TaxID=7782 RepID=UPI0024547520|nr:leucine-rich repeat and immunoglobulin-like domain-containing nogo receptor-interacting protein 3 [Leucoraja erinacea]
MLCSLCFQAMMLLPGTALSLVLLACVCARGVSQDCPPSCECGWGNGTVSCRGRELPAIPGWLPPATRMLDLSGNLIELAGRGALANLSELLELDLRDNLVSNMEPGALSSLGRLQILHLDGNRLKTIWPGTLASMANLTTLGLSRNPLLLLLDDTFQGLDNLGSLDLGEELVYVGARAFEGLVGLHHLSLTQAETGTLPSAALSRLPGLETLRVLGLGTISLAGDSFPGLARLRELRVESWRRLESLHQDALAGLNLTTLAITRCNLSRVPGEALAHLVYLRSLDLSHNPVASMAGGALPGLHRLAELRLVGGLLSHIQTGALHSLGSLRLLDLTGNRLATLEAGALPSVGGLAWLGLASNPLACDCRLAWAVGRGRGLEWGPGPTVCAGPGDLRGRELAELGSGRGAGLSACTKPTVRAESGVVTVGEGQTVSLPCQAQGEPRPTVSWTTPAGSQLGPGDASRLRVLPDGSLQVRLAQAWDAGVYVCTASNAAGTHSTPTRLLVWTGPGSSPVLGPQALWVVMSLGLACFLGVTGLCFTMLLVWSRWQGPVKRNSSVEVLRNPSNSDTQSEAIKYTTKML